MSVTVFSPPPRVGGTAEQQLKAQYAYLFQMSQQLTAALARMDGQSLTVDHRTQQVTAQQQQQYQNLKALVIKSADTVQKQMDTVAQELKGSFVAQSDFGSYVENLNAYIEANPQALTHYYKIASDLQSDADALGTAFSRYVTETEGYIRTGIVDYNGAVPVYGVAVGQGLATETVTLSDGTAATYIQPRQFRSVFTASKLSFYQDDVEVAYLSNNRLYITDAQITGRVFLGDDWQLERSSGLTLKWIGG